jgi:hypothetical protein
VPLHNNGAGSGPADGPPGPITADFDLTADEVVARDQHAALNIRPGAQLIHVGTGGAITAKPYVLSGGAVNAEGGVVDLEAVEEVAAAGAPVPGAKKKAGGRVMTEEQKKAAAEKRKATMERKKAEKAAAAAAAAGEAGAGADGGAAPAEGAVAEEGSSLDTTVAEQQ